MSLIRASRLRQALGGAIVAMGLAGSASAETPSRDEAMAETLFADAKRLMASGNYASACPKLAESYRLDPGGGTLTALALCHEQIGKTATAWAEFIEVRTAAQQAGRADREKYARQHIAALEPTLSRLTIAVDPATARLPDLAVRRDRILVGSASWGVASPVDPGEHVIEAIAPGKLAWTTRVVLSESGDSKSVAIPELDDETRPAETAAAGDPAAAMGQAAPEPAEPETDALPRAHRGGPQRTIGLVIGAAGLASLGVGAYFGVQALSKSHDAKKVCSPSSCMDPNAVQANEDAKTDAAAADGLLGGGLVAFIAGAILFFSAPSDPADAPADTPEGKSSAGLRDLRVFPAVGRRGGGMVVQAQW